MKMYVQIKRSDFTVLCINTSDEFGHQMRRVFWFIVRQKPRLSVARSIDTITIYYRSVNADGPPAQWCQIYADDDAKPNVGFDAALIRERGFSGWRPDTVCLFKMIYLTFVHMWNVMTSVFFGPIASDVMWCGVMCVNGKIPVDECQTRWHNLISGLLETMYINTNVCVGVTLGNRFYN